LDLSDFEEFRVETSAWNCCPATQGAVFDATIRREPNGTYTVEMRVVGEEQQGIGECSDDTMVQVCPTSDFANATCAPLIDVPLRDLTEEEVVGMRDLFRRVRIRTQPVSPCFPLLVDPLSYTKFTWDDVWASDFICDSRYLLAESAAPILEFLSDLRSVVSSPKDQRGEVKHLHDRGNGGRDVGHGRGA
jgi:hypothetical protein